MANPVGRPSKYNQDMLDKCNEYARGGWKKEEPVPTIAGLAVVIGVNRKTIHEWAKEQDKEEFCNIIEGLLATQERELIKQGLSKVFDSGLTKLFLTKHGYSDKQQTDHTSSDGSMTPKPFSGLYGTTKSESD